METDAIYFARRAAEERAAAMRAVNLKARKAHREMAERYDDLASAIAGRERALNLNTARVC